MVIPITLSHRDFFRMNLEILKSFPPFSELRSKELDVLAEILFYNYKYKDIDPLVRGKVIFDYSTKVEMRSNLQMDEQSFNNHLTTLRKKGILDKRNLISNYGINPSTPVITFNFKLEKDGSK
jgi:hypothetical protein